METWQTPLVTLTAGPAGGKGEKLDLDCDQVVVHKDPAGDYLVISRVEASQLNEINWSPESVTFAAVGAVDPQEFKIKSAKAGGDGKSIQLHLA